MPARRWECALTGIPESIRQARRWSRDFLPPCDGRDDLEAIAHELAMNAVQHTASGEPGGTFTLDISWWHAPGTSRRPAPDFLRFVIGDQGGATRPRLIRDADGEHNRGLLMVHGLSAPSIQAWCSWPDTRDVPPVTAPSPQALTALLTTGPPRR